MLSQEHTASFSHTGSLTMNPHPETERAQRDLNILFVDDDPAFSRPIALYLNKHLGHNTKLANSAEQAYAELLRSNFDVIILDYKLTDGSGLDVLRWISENKIDTPVIFVTGYGTEEVAVEAMKLGAYDYVNKGHISIDYVPVLIHRSFERYRIDKQQRQRATALQAFQNAVHSSLFLITKSLDAIARSVEAQREQAVGSDDPMSRQTIGDPLVGIEQEVRTIKEIVASLDDLNDLLSQQPPINQGTKDLTSNSTSTSH